MNFFFKRGKYYFFSTRRFICKNSYLRVKIYPRIALISDPGKKPSPVTLNSTHQFSIHPEPILSRICDKIIIKFKVKRT